MRPYSVEIYSPDFQLKQHYNSGEISYKYDYLSMVENSISIKYDQNVTQGDYIWITRGDRRYFGIIKSITVGQQTNATSQLRYVPFESIFDRDIMFDTDLQGSGSLLEQVIADTIKTYWVTNEDKVQNVLGLKIETISATKDWGFHITSDVAGLHKAIISFSNSIIRRAMTKYQIGLYVEPDFEKKEITVKIGKKSTEKFCIEADLPNVFKKSIVLDEKTQDTNKLVIYDNKNLEDMITYYRHPDKSFDTVDKDRITPVVYDIVSVTVQQDQTFQQAAAQYAAKSFDRESFRNLIELTVLNDDKLANPASLIIGQEVSVISNGAEYASILTGRDVGDVTKLIFGTIRLDLTKILKGEKRNGK